MTTPVLPDYAAPFKPVPNVTPFTIRDGVTMLKKLDGMQKYIQRILTPWINENFSDLADAFETQAQYLIAQVNEAIGDLDGESVEETVDALTAYINSQVELIINNSIELQDPVLEGLLSNTESASYDVLRGYFDTAILDSRADILAQMQTSESDIANEISKTVSPGALLDASRTVVVGDSLTRGADSETVKAFRGSWFTNASHESNGLIRLFKNAAHGGYNSDQLKALFDSEVLSTNPTLVGLMCGRNDTPDGSGYPTMLINFVTEAVEKCRSRGIGVFLVNTVPQGNAPLATPNAPTVTHSYTGTTMEARTYRYKITAGNGGAGAIVGETLPSIAGASLALSGVGATVKVTWDHVPGANWYKIYRETTDGSGVYQLLNTISPGASTVGIGSTYYYDTNGSASLGTVPPASNTTGNSTAYALERARINAWLAQYAKTEGIPLIDNYTLWTDPLTGMYKTGLTYDGTHPTGKANALLGNEVAKTLLPLIRPAIPIVAGSAFDPLNLSINGLFTDGSATLPTGFVKTILLSDASAITARELRTGFKGYALRVENPAPTYTSVKGPSLTGIIVGHRIVVSCVVETELATNGARAFVALRNQVNAPLVEFQLQEVDREPKILSAEFIVPSGTTSAHWLIETGGQGMVAIGQLTIYDLTSEAYLPI